MLKDVPYTWVRGKSVQIRVEPETKILALIPSNLDGVFVS